MFHLHSNTRIYPAVLRFALMFCFLLSFPGCSPRHSIYSMGIPLAGTTAPTLQTGDSHAPATLPLIAETLSVPETNISITGVKLPPASCCYATMGHSDPGYRHEADLPGHDGTHDHSEEHGIHPRRLPRALRLLMLLFLVTVFL